MLYALAEQHAGYFTARQAGEQGVSRQLLRHHVERGAIARVAHGIYRLNRFPAQRFEDIAIAVLWAGHGAVASHETALVVHGVGEAMPLVIHLTLPVKFRGKRHGVVVHVSTLQPSDCVLREGISVTSVARTLLDVASNADIAASRVATADAVARGLVTKRSLRDAADKIKNGHELLRRLGIEAQ